MSAEEFRSRRETCEELKEDVFDTWCVRGDLERRFLVTAGDTVIQGVLWKERVIQIVQAGNMGFFYSRTNKTLCE